MDGHLGCFHVRAVVNSAAMNNGVHMFSSILVSSGYMPRSGIAGSCCGFIPSSDQFFSPLFDWVVCFPSIELYVLLIYFGN